MDVLAGSGILLRLLWSRVTWPRSQGVVIFVGVPVAFFIGSLCYAGPPHGIVFGLLYGTAAIMLPVALMVLQGLLKAWAEWPSEHPTATFTRHRSPVSCL